ncbi:hypothetical protein nbrc107696_11640 [Gordonia spumicola]|uniref:Uncharacterized protein n=1 Tax=Gordonia spumicola TaxID=589161 RepID=A0A7I9V5M7_9ACTN|nr:hypothetical protein [Gordonia spumicola]GEE00718.1 hypothetical protein nbrc107696_11640 [Gordonia spumicola]
MKPDRLVAAVTAVVGLIGLGLTLLPLVTFKASERAIKSGAIDSVLYGTDSFNAEKWEERCRRYNEFCSGGGGARLDVSMFDLIASSYAAIAIVPIALALCGAAGAMTVWRTHDPRVFTAVTAVSLGALVVLLFTALNPSVAVSGTGDFRDWGSAGSTIGSEDFSASVGAGLYLSAIALAAILGVNAWRALTALRAAR